MPQSNLITPCVRVCRLNERQECVGCRRTLDEIARWRDMTDAERAAVMLRVVKTGETVAVSPVRTEEVSR